MFNQKQKFGAYFFILALILSVTFCLLFLENFKSYSSQITVLFIPKNEKIAVQSEQIVQNLTEFPRNLSFYEKLLDDNKNIKDEFSGYSNDKRKKLWNKGLEISREKNSGVIEIEIADDNQIESEKIARQAAFTLFSLAGKYYNIKNEIDLRIVDGPITGLKIKNWPWLLCLSVLMGVCLSYLVMAVFSRLEASLLKIKDWNKIGSTKPYAQKFFNWTPVTRSDNQTRNVGKPKRETELFVSAKKSQAPDNLPIEKKPNVSKEKISLGENTEREINLNKEPSEEELKERLNQLLRGEL